MQVGVLRGRHGLQALCTLQTNEPGELENVGTGCGLGDIKLWDSKTRRVYACKSGAHCKLYGVFCLQTFRESSRMISQGRDGLVKVWDLNTFGDSAEPLQSIDTKSQGFCKCSCLPSKGLLACTGEEETCAYIWELGTGNLVAKAPPPGDGDDKVGMCMGVKLTEENDPHLMALYENGFLYTYHVSSNQWVDELCVRLHQSVPIAFDTTKGKKKILGVSCGASSSVSAFTLDLNKHKAKLNASIQMFKNKTDKDDTGRGFSDIKIRPDDCRLFACAGWDGGVKLVEWQKLKPLGTLCYHTGPVHSVAFGTKGFLASAGQDGNVALWSAYPPTEDAS